MLGLLCFPELGFKVLPLCQAEICLQCRPGFLKNWLVSKRSRLFQCHWNKLQGLKKLGLSFRIAESRKNLFIFFDFQKVSGYESFKTALEIVSIAKSISSPVVYFPVEMRTVPAAVNNSIFIALSTGDISVIPE